MNSALLIIAGAYAGYKCIKKFVVVPRYVKANLKKYSNSDNVKILELPEILKKADIIYKSQEDRIDILEAINVILFKLSKQDIRYLNCIDIVEDTSKRLSANANYNMCIDNMIFRIWEEMH